MLQLRADNRNLVSNAKSAILLDNTPSGTGSLVLSNITNAAVNIPILIGEIGHSDAEIFVIAAVSPSTNTITIKDSSGNIAVTAQAHAESSKVYFLNYNQIRFYWTAATGTIADENPVFDTLNPLTGYIDLDPTSFYTTYMDLTNDSGFGWFQYLNSNALLLSQESNPIPYIGFEGNTIGTVMAEFESLLNVNELKLITVADKFAWFNEGLSNLVNRLNLNNVEFTLSNTITINLLAGVAEYQLPNDFSDLVEVIFSDGRKMDVISSSNIMSYADSVTKYYIRGRYIGFVPTPTTSAVVYYRYRTKSTKATNLSQYIQLPDNMHMAIKDWMLFRANLKFSNPLANTNKQIFNDALDNYVLAAVKRNASNDSWGISNSSNA